jgi:hypothetical protein
MSLSCSLCSYTTSRRYNLDRHTKTVHKRDLPIVDPNLQNVDPNLPNVDPNLQNVDPNLQNVDPNLPDVNPNLPNVNSTLCEACGKTFLNKYTLKRHKERNSCKGSDVSFQCQYCKDVFSSSSSKSHHVKICKKREHDNQGSNDAIQAPTTSIVGNNNNIITNTNTQVNIQQNQHITLNFPDGMEDPNFAFLKDHITMGRFEKLIGHSKPEISFSRYAGAIMERPENRFIYKSSPNTKHCKVHMDDKWEFVLDEDAFPILTFHMSCAALEDTHQYKKMSKRPKIDIVSLLRYLDDINTENEDNPNYRLAIERLKLKIINLSQSHKIPQSDLSLDNDKNNRILI